MSSSSGVRVSPEVNEEFEKLKNGSLSFIICNLVKRFQEIVVEKSCTQTDWEDFLAELPETECRWVIYDIHAVTEEGAKNKIALISWSPNAANIKASSPTKKHYLNIKLTVNQPKMLFASSQDALKRALDGIEAELTCTDKVEVDHNVVLDKLFRISRH
ncbi:hypothetical protein KAF25_001194 [Fusarium avenaceum]|uniref:Cofilin n=1 Tax=Fusarium avenaceum TaxID=40199 RepID=A0A9P7HBA3_9HYPO|nr:hypothetical protein KAF25_001194 [Fusarium avenaceum]